MTSDFKLYANKQTSDIRNSIQDWWFYHFVVLRVLFVLSFLVFTLVKKKSVRMVLF